MPKMKTKPTTDGALKYPELIFGVIGAVGTDTERVISELQSALMQVKYNTVQIHLIDNLRQFKKWAKIKAGPLDTNYSRLMDAGNAFRKILKRSDALAMLGVAAVFHRRKESTGDGGTPKAQTAYAFRSLKRPEEVQTLRRIYGANFFALAAYSSKAKRIERLANKIAQSRVCQVTPDVMRTARALIDRDEAELSEKFGQNIQDAFPISDFFVDADSPKLTDQVRRIIELIFGNTFHTPTRDEYGMFHAWSASLRSAALARQVGAAICTVDGEILTTGCNEVPKAHGGLYWPGDEPDERDHQRGEDSNDVMKREILADLLDRLKKGHWLNKKLSLLSPRELLELALFDKSPEGLRRATLMGITEYGRMVHAEMSALMQAARLGVSVKGTVLYATTFPCHNCTKHIVAAGIERLAYIEPYPKSRATDLHGDSISVEDLQTGKRVAFHSFIGVSPRQYFRLFSLGDSSRKEGINVKKWISQESAPRFAESPFAYLKREVEELGVFDLLLKSHKLVAE
jgi:cytidine deaminase